MEMDCPYLMKLTWKLNEIMCINCLTHCLALWILNRSWLCILLWGLFQLVFCIHGFHICGFNQSQVEISAHGYRVSTPLGHFVWGTWASVDIGICWGPGPNPLKILRDDCIVFHLILLRRTSFSLISFK